MLLNKSKKLIEDPSNKNLKIFFNKEKRLLAKVEEISLDVFKIFVCKTTLEVRTFLTSNKMPEYPDYTAIFELDKSKKELFLKGFEEYSDTADDVYHLDDPQIPFFQP